VAYTLQKALPDLYYIALTTLMIMPILAVLLCLFETHHDDNFFTYRGVPSTASHPLSVSKTGLSHQCYGHIDFHPKLTDMTDSRASACKRLIVSKSISSAASHSALVHTNVDDVDWLRLLLQEQ